MKGPLSVSPNKAMLLREKRIKREGELPYGDKWQRGKEAREKN